MSSQNSIQDEKFIAGETKTLMFYIEDERGNPMDLRGYTATLKVCRWGSYNSVILQRDCVVDADTTLGLVKYNLISSDTNTWSDGTYRFQLTLIYNDQITYKKQGNWYIRGVVG